MWPCLQKCALELNTNVCTQKFSVDMAGPKKNKSLTHFFEVPFYNPTKPIINQTPEIFMLVCFTYFIKPNFNILSYHTFGLGSVRIEIYTFVLLNYLDQFVGYLRLSNTKRCLQIFRYHLIWIIMFLKWKYISK